MNLADEEMIEVNNLTADRINKDFLERIAEKVLIGENKQGLELSIVLVCQDRIKELNKKYRRRNKSTDVLSFGYGDSDEIVICLQEIKKNAKKFRSTFKKELVRVLIHGILHLLGYDHEKSGKEAQIMKKRESHYLSKV